MHQGHQIWGRRRRPGGLRFATPGPGSKAAWTRHPRRVLGFATAGHAEEDRRGPSWAFGLGGPTSSWNHPETHGVGPASCKMWHQLRGFNGFQIMYDYRRKFRSQTSDNMDRWKAEQGRGREKRKIRRKKSRRERVRRKKMQMREKVGKSRNTLFFQWFGAPEGRKVGSLKRRVRSQLAKWEMKNCTPLWREAHFEVKMYKTQHSRTTFGSCDVEKVHAVVARSTFRSQNVQNTPLSDHFWKLRCRKSARRCGAKHISKSKCTKHTRSGPLLEVEMSKKCTPLWHEAHFEVKMYKTPHVRATFGTSDVEKVHTAVARSIFRSENVQNTTRSRHFWKFRCRKSARPCGTKHISKSKC